MEGSGDGWTGGGAETDLHIEVYIILTKIFSTYS